MRRLLPLLLLAGCATGPGIEARLAPLVGGSEAALVEALGVPTRTHEAGGLRFLQYEERRAGPASARPLLSAAPSAASPPIPWPGRCC